MPAEEAKWNPKKLIMSQFYLKSTNFLPTVWMHALCFGKSGRKWICNVKKLEPLFLVQPSYCEKTNKNWRLTTKTSNNNTFDPTKIFTFMRIRAAENKFSYKFKRVFGFVMEYAWVSKPLHDATFSWWPREVKKGSIVKKQTDLLKMDTNIIFCIQ